MIRQSIRLPASHCFVCFFCSVRDSESDGQLRRLSTAPKSSAHHSSPRLLPPTQELTSSVLSHLILLV
jgi:hypothetical protein